MIEIQWICVDFLETTLTPAHVLYHLQINDTSWKKQYVIDTWYTIYNSNEDVLSKITQKNERQARKQKTMVSHSILQDQE